VVVVVVVIVPIVVVVVVVETRSIRSTLGPVAATRGRLVVSTWLRRRWPRDPNQY